MRKKYLERRKQELTDCYQALNAKNLNFFAVIGHKLKGNASTYGHPELAVIGEEIEKYSLNQNWNQLMILTEKLNDYLSKAKI